MKNSMLGNFRKVTSGLAQIAVTCIKLVVEAFLESCGIWVSPRLLWLAAVQKKKKLNMAKKEQQHFWT